MKKILSTMQQGNEVVPVLPEIMDYEYVKIMSKSSGRNSANSSKKKDFPPPVVVNIAAMGFRCWSCPVPLVCWYSLQAKAATAVRIALSRPTRLNLASLMANYTLC